MAGGLTYKSSGLGSAVRDINKAAKHVDKRLYKARKSIHKGVVKTHGSITKRVKHRVYESGKNRMADRMSSEDRKKFILSETKKEMERQKKSNKKKYGYENYKPVKADKIYSQNVKRYGEKTKKQRSGLAPAKPKYNKWGDRIS